VAPLNENPEMPVLRPENSDFVFPAGRYALVLKGQAYDFTVAGSITDAANASSGSKRRMDRSIPNVGIHDRRGGPAHNRRARLANSLPVRRSDA
jgi:hypothetical protein